MTNKELDLQALNKLIEDAEKRRQELLGKQTPTNAFDKIIKETESAISEEEEEEEEEEDNIPRESELDEEIIKRTGNVKVQIRGQIIKRGPKWAYFELDNTLCKYNLEKTYLPKILISINGDADPESPGYPFKDSFKTGFNYCVVCDLSVDMEKKTRKVVNRFWLRRFAPIIEDV